MKISEFKNSTLSAEDASATKAALELKPNYNYAYGNLLTSWSSAIERLVRRKCAEEVKDLGELILNNAWLESLENKIRDVNERVEKYIEETNGGAAILTDDEVILGLLVLIKQDFDNLRKDVTVEFEAMCREERVDDLSRFLTENTWSLELLSDMGFNLSKIALESGNVDILGIIFEQDKKIAEYKMEFLNLVLVQKNLDVINFLLEGEKYSAGEILSILGNEEYYSSSEQIVDMLSSFLSQNGHNSDVLYYKAMFLYKSDDFVNAISLFDEVLSISEVSEQKQKAQLHKGLCLQYLGQIDEAKAIFELVVGEKNDYPLVTDSAQKNLDFLNELESRIERVETLMESWRSGENNLLSQHKEFIHGYLQKLEASMKQQTFTAAKDVKQDINTLLLQIKFISLKQDAPAAVVSAQEFVDLPDLYAQMIQEVDEAVLQEYTTAVEKIDDTMKAIGDITEGL